MVVEAAAIHILAHEFDNLSVLLATAAHMYVIFEVIGIVVDVAVVIDNFHLDIVVDIACACAMVMPVEMLHDLYIDEVVWVAVVDDTFRLCFDYLMAVRSALLMWVAVLVRAVRYDCIPLSSDDEPAAAADTVLRCYFDEFADMKRCSHDFVGTELGSYFDGLLTDKEAAIHLADRTLVYYSCGFVVPNNRHNYCTL